MTTTSSPQPSGTTQPATASENNAPQAADQGSLKADELVRQAVEGRTRVGVQPGQRAFVELASPYRATTQCGDLAAMAAARTSSAIRSGYGP